jgi:hypothetical protein
LQPHNVSPSLIRAHNANEASFNSIFTLQLRAVSENTLAGRLSRLLVYLSLVLLAHALYIEWSVIQLKILSAIAF